MTTFRDRVVLITGAARGIGRGLARALAAQGARVGGIDRRADLLESLPGECAGASVATAVADVTDPVALRAAVEQLERVLGPVDVLIASAGIARRTSAREEFLEGLTAEIQVNLIGVAAAFATVLPGMRQRRRGRLVAISSLASYRGIPWLAGYCASKAGVNALCDAFRVELASEGIGVTTICPGFIDTDMPREFDPSGVSPPPRMICVDEAVRHILYAIARGKRLYAFPWRDWSLIWLLRHLPRGLSDRIVAGLIRRRRQGSLPEEVK